MDEITITLPAYAARYLAEMCDRERKRLASLDANSGILLPLIAAHDSLDAIASAIPILEV